MSTTEDFNLKEYYERLKGVFKKISSLPLEMTSARNQPKLKVTSSESESSDDETSEDETSSEEDSSESTSTSDSEETSSSDDSSESDSESESTSEESDSDDDSSESSSESDSSSETSDTSEEESTKKPTLAKRVVSTTNGKLKDPSNELKVESPKVNQKKAK
ncbi:hypothetical protein Aperf_G00000024590 [Anoplocephala perfoliata]